MHPALSCVSKRMPNVREKIARLFELNEDFRDLCEEYQSCCDACARLAATSSNDAVRGEYEALLLRLEGELLRYLAEHPQV